VASYRLSVSTISRSAGRSATAAAAYRAAARVHDARTGEVHDYTRKGGVLHSEIIVPAEAPEWARDREALWNAAEISETRRNSTVARDFVVSLPAELSAAQRRSLALTLGSEISTRHHCAVEVAVHKPGRGGDDRNFHAHLLCSTRRLRAEGFQEKTRELDERKSGEIDYWRERWAHLQNERLQAHGHAERVDHRSLKDQGIDREPTTHLGPAVSGMQRRGMETEVGARIQAEAQARLERAAELGRLERESAAIGQSILVLDGDIRSALQARDAQQRSTTPDRTAARDPDAARSAARERWLEYREGKGTGEDKGAEPTRGKDKGRDTPDDDFSL